MQTMRAKIDDVRERRAMLNFYYDQASALDKRANADHTRALTAQNHARYAALFSISHLALAFVCAWSQDTAVMVINIGLVVFFIEGWTWWRQRHAMWSRFAMESRSLANEYAAMGAAMVMPRASA